MQLYSYRRAPKRPIQKRLPFSSGLTAFGGGRTEYLYYRNRRAPPLRLRKLLPVVAAAVVTPTPFGGGRTEYLFYRNRRTPPLRLRKVLPIVTANVVTPTPFGGGRTAYLYYVSRRLRARRPQLRTISPVAALVLFPARRQRRMKRRVLRLKPRLLQTMAAPLGFFPVTKVPRPKIKRRRNIVRGRIFPTMAAPVGFFPTKKFPRPKIKRGKWSNRRYAQRFYEFPGVKPIVTAAIEWIIRARRRGRR